MKHRLALLAIVTILLSVATVKAQGETARPYARVRGLDVARAVEKTRRGYSNASPEILAKVRKAYDKTRSDSSTQERATINGATLPNPRLPGTWFCTVPLDDTTVFHAFHTFGSDGTFVETSSLLGTLIEGPAHGVWEYRDRDVVLTFEVFEFDPDGNEIGRVRVRNLIRLDDENHFTSYCVVDFIDLNGEITEGIASATYTAVRMQLRGL